MTVQAEERQSTPWTAAALTVASVLVVAVTITWTFLVMRSVMGVGGACADGGPYVSAQPCPGGSWLIAPAIPLMVISAMLGTVFASQVGAPDLLVPMWAALFGSLGWNFLEFAFTGPDLVWGWLVCGVVFWLMALPAVLLMLSQLRKTSATPGRKVWWLPGYGLIGAVGLLLGWASFVAVSG